MGKLDQINIEAIKAQFADMVANPQVVKSKKDLIADLAADIKQLVGLGYSIPQILGVLNSNGMDLKESTLKNYLVNASKRVSQAQPENTPAPPPPPPSKKNRKKTAKPKTEKPQETAPTTPDTSADPQQVEDGQIVIASDSV